MDIEEIRFHLKRAATPLDWPKDGWLQRSIEAANSQLWLESRLLKILEFLLADK